MADFKFAMNFNAAATLVIAVLTALLPLRYPNQNLFHTLPTTMVVLVLSTILNYLLLIGILLFPSSRFSAMAKHLTPFFAYVAVSSLVAALFPDHRATTASIYTVFGLLVAGHAFFLLGGFTVEDNVIDEDEAQNQTWYERFTRSFRRYKNKLVRDVAGFFQERTTTQLAEAPPH